MAQDAAAVVRGVVEADAPPVARRRPIDAIVVVRVATVGVISQGSEDDGRGVCAVGHQGAVHGQIAAGILELDHRTRLHGQGRTAVDRQPALDHVHQIGIPGLVEGHGAAHPHAVNLVVVRLVAGEGGIAGGVHVHGVAAVAPETVVADGPGRCAFQPDAAGAVVQNPVVL